MSSKNQVWLEAIRHVLHRFDYPEKDAAVVAAPDPNIVLPASQALTDDAADTGTFSF